MEIVIILFHVFLSSNHFHHNKMDMVTKLKDLSILEVSDRNAICRFVHSLKMELVVSDGNVSLE